MQVTLKPNLVLNNSVYYTIPVGPDSGTCTRIISDTPVANASLESGAEKYDISLGVDKTVIWEGRLYTTQINSRFRFNIVCTFCHGYECEYDAPPWQVVGNLPTITATIEDGLALPSERLVKYSCLGGYLAYDDGSAYLCRGIESATTADVV